MKQGEVEDKIGEIKTRSYRALKARKDLDFSLMKWEAIGGL